MPISQKNNHYSLGARPSHLAATKRKPISHLVCDACSTTSPLNCAASLCSQ
ncbi:hypothetical protein FRX31_025645, partial [Thalictrum thalictroides]